LGARPSQRSRKGSKTVAQISTQIILTATKLAVFKSSGYDRMKSDLKSLRGLIVGEMLESNKPWEILVGQVLGRLRRSEETDYGGDGSIWRFLGEKTAIALIPAA
jgi:hypothetical protein